MCLFRSVYWTLVACHRSRHRHLCHVFPNWIFLSSIGAIRMMCIFAWSRIFIRISLESPYSVAPLPFIRCGMVGVVFWSWLIHRFDLSFCPTIINVRSSVLIISRPSVETRRVSFLFGIAKCLVLGVRSRCQMSFLYVFFSLEEKTEVSRSNCCFTLRRFQIFDDGIRCGMKKNTSAVATDVTKFHVYVARGTLDLVRKLQELESFGVALFFDDFCWLELRSPAMKPPSLDL